tara:strand:- start:10469 stop:10603 length:135 start_codon:yes stop_codon:yes gene_type:complete
MNGLVKANEKKLLLWWFIMMVMIIAIVTSITGCDGGWSVAGYDL